MALGDRLNAGAEDLTQIGRRIHGHDDDAEHVVIDLDAGQRQTEERDIDLQERRRTANDIHVDAGEAAQDARLGDAHERQGETEGNCQRKRHKHDRKRHEEALEDDRQALDQNDRVQEQAQEHIGVPRLDPRLLFKVSQEVIEGRHALDLHRRNLGDLLGRAIGQSEGAAKGLIAALDGEGHAVNLDAEIAAGRRRLTKVNLERLAVSLARRFHGRTIHEVLAREHRQSRVIGTKRRAVDKRQRKTAQLLVGIGLNFPGNARLGAADHIAARTGVGSGGNLCGLKRLSGRGRICPRTHQRERHGHDAGQLLEHRGQWKTLLRGPFVQSRQGGSYRRSYRQNETETLSVKRSAKALSAKTERARAQSSSYFT